MESRLLLENLPYADSVNAWPSCSLWTLKVTFWSLLKIILKAQTKNCLQGHPKMGQVWTVCEYDWMTDSRKRTQKECYTIMWVQFVKLLENRLKELIELKFWLSNYFQKMILNLCNLLKAIWKIYFAIFFICTFLRMVNFSKLLQITKNK